MIAFIGPLPPPVHGFSWVNQQVLDRLRLRAPVTVWDRTKPRFGITRFDKVSSILIGTIQSALFLLSLVVRRPRALYLGCSGGAGMLLDMPFIAFARWFSVPVFVHHHAFSYLNSPSRFSNFCLQRMANCQHIVLCRLMGEKLKDVYSIPNENITVISNAAFLAAEEVEGVVNNGRITVGFLSNITFEKGILDFFDLAEHFVRRTNSPEFVIAGPVDPSLCEIFEHRLKALANVRYIGAVYGTHKENFYRSVDVLAFPTRYANEAEPVTILEAFRSGVPVVANIRGCIGTMLDESCGFAVAQTSDFVSDAAEWIEQLLASPDGLTNLKIAAKARFNGLQEEHAQRLENLLDFISSGEQLRIVP